MSAVSVLVLACLWVVAATIVAFLPMRHQYVPGLALLLAAPVLIVLLGLAFGVWMVLVGLFGFVSMFRRPLRYWIGRAWRRGRPGR